MKKATAFVLASLVVSGFSGTASETSPEPIQTWIGMQGPAGWIAPQEMSLEIGGMAWSITRDGGVGVVTPTLTGIVDVRLLAVADCGLLAAFEVGAGSSHVIHFGDDGAITVEEITGQPIAMGPGLVERAPTGCDTGISHEAAIATALHEAPGKVTSLISAAPGALGAFVGPGTLPKGPRDQLVWAVVFGGVFGPFSCGPAPPPGQQPHCPDPQHSALVVLDLMTGQFIMGSVPADAS